MNLPDEILAHFQADALGPMLGVPDLKAREQHPLRARFLDFLASLDAEAIAPILRDPGLDNYLMGGDTADRDAAARELYVIRLLSQQVPARRLLALSFPEARPRPYQHDALADLALTDGGLVRLAAFRYDGSVLERNGFSFLPAPATQGPNAAYWLFQHLGKPDLRDSVLIRLDPFMFGPRDHFPRMGYRMNIFGRSLNWDRLANLKEAEHGRWRPDRWTFGVNFTDYVWEPRNGEVHFTCEELPDTGTAATRGARYLHAVYNPSSRVITHLDGALRIYSESALSSRATMHVQDAGKVGTRVKLFRTDRPIPPDRFCDVAAAFYVWNNDAIRYFAPSAAWPSVPARDGK